MRRTFKSLSVCDKISSMKKFKQVLSIYLVFMGLFISFNSFALVDLNLGTYVSSFNQVQVNTSGQTRTFSFTPYFGVGADFELWGPIYFHPEFGLIKYTDTQTNYEKQEIFLHYNFDYQLSTSLTPRFGLTTHWLQIKGKGGKKKMNNGSGYATFDSPAVTTTSYFTTLNLGLKADISPIYYLRFDFLLNDWKDISQASYNYLLTLNRFW